MFTYRVLLIVGSMYMSPSTDMWLSLGLCIIGSCILQTLGDQNLLALQVFHFGFVTLDLDPPGACSKVGVGLQGAGCAAVFSTTFLWLETLVSTKIVKSQKYFYEWLETLVS